MKEYFFILGRYPTISIAEISKVLEHHKVDYTITQCSSEAIVIKATSPIDPATLIKRLGGTVKLGEISETMNLSEDEANFSRIFSYTNIQNYFSLVEPKKVHVGISIYNVGGNLTHLSYLTKHLPGFNSIIKANLQKEGFKVGFVQIKERYLSSVSVEKNKLLSSGFELVLLLGESTLSIGKTVAVQEFEEFSFRDIGRPFLDKRSGIMPPKLARMMINIANIDVGDTLLDPFCGSGTIIQEAAILGIKSIIGTDKNAKAINDSRINIAWLKKRVGISFQEKTIQINLADVQTLAKIIPSQSVAAIVTEPYLGPPLEQKPNRERVMQILSELKSFYLSAFGEFRKILKDMGIIVIIFPTFENNEQWQSIPINEILHLGYSLEQALPKTVPDTIRRLLTERGTMRYGSEGQFSYREILCFRKLKREV